MLAKKKNYLLAFWRKVGFAWAIQSPKQDNQPLASSNGVPVARVLCCVIFPWVRTDPQTHSFAVLIIQQARVLHDEHSTWKSHCYSNTLHREHFLNIIATDIRCSTMAISGGMVSICIYKGFIYVQSNHFSNRDMLVHSSQDVNKHI